MCVTDMLEKTLHEVVQSVDRHTHLGPLVFVAGLIGGLVFVSNQLHWLSILYFPPLAAAGYKLFVDPDTQRRFPWQFPTALTYGALSGWAALLITKRFFAPMPHSAFHVDPVGAVISIMITGIGLWLMNIDLPPALAVGLLLPFAGLPPKLYMINVAIGSTTVAVLIWLARTMIRGQSECQSSKAT